MYRIDSGAGWIVVDTNNKRIAHKEGVKEFGRGGINSIARATQEDIDYFINLKGEDAVRIE